MTIKRFILKSNSRKGEIFQTFTFAIIAVFICSIANAQENRENFNFSVGTEYRITPITNVSNSAGQPLLPISVERDRQLSGFGIHYTLGWEFIRNLSFNFSHAFRYNYVYDQRTTIVGDFAKVDDTPVYRLLMDYHFYLEKHFSLNSHESLFLRLGISLANTGSRYATQTVVDFGEDQLFAVSSDGSLRWNPSNIGLGYQSKMMKVTLGAYISKNHEFGTVEEPNARIILPYINLSYSLKKF